MKNWLIFGAIAGVLVAALSWSQLAFLVIGAVAAIVVLPLLMLARR